MGEVDNTISALEYGLTHKLLKVMMFWISSCQRPISDHEGSEHQPAAMKPSRTDSKSHS